MKRVSKDKIIYSMSAQNKPVLYVEPGTQVQFEIWDGFRGQIKSNDEVFNGLDWEHINPATGPIYINNAEVGDILSVRVDSIDVAQTGVVICGKDMGVMGSVLQENVVKIIPVKGDIAYYSEEIQLPINKMIGVIGVAPQKGEIPCGVPDLHGGNMDCKEIKEGATLLLPVNVPGALLSMGDLHAVMADGEIGVTGLEIAGNVTVTVDIIKNISLPLPMIWNDSHVMTIASDSDLDIAVEMAVANMIKFLTETEGFTMGDAIMLTSLVADTRICQVVDPKKTARVEFPKKYLGSIQP